MVTWSLLQELAQISGLNLCLLWSYTSSGFSGLIILMPSFSANFMSKLSSRYHYICPFQLNWFYLSLCFTLAEIQKCKCCCNQIWLLVSHRNKVTFFRAIVRHFHCFTLDTSEFTPKLAFVVLIYNFIYFAPFCIIYWILLCQLKKKIFYLRSTIMCNIISRLMSTGKYPTKCSVFKITYVKHINPLLIHLYHI